MGAASQGTAARAAPLPNPATPGKAPGRPIEIEEWSNRSLIHPLSRRLVTLLIPTGISPNMVSISGLGVAAAAAAAYVLPPWPFSAFAGFALQIVWHVFDGADGDLARRTGRASTSGEIVDGICDHASQLILYGTFAVLLSAQIGPGAWALAALAALSHFLQANAYETARRKYRRWGYGATSLREELVASSSRPGAREMLGRIYVAVSRLLQVPEDELSAAMQRATATGPAAEAAAQTLYRDTHRRVVKSGSWLSSNQRTIAAFVSMLIGSPLYFFLFEVTVLNGVLVWLNLRERAQDKELFAALQTLKV
jgi:phosphatidylglycerophosphate synthase